MAWSGAPVPTFSAKRHEIEKRIRQRTLADWTTLLTPTGVPSAPILTREEALASEHAQQNGVMGQTTVEGAPAWFSRAGVTISTPAESATPMHLPTPARIGEHTDEVLHEIGLGNLVGRFPVNRFLEFSRRGGPSRVHDIAMTEEM